MNIRMEVPDELYLSYKEKSEKLGFSVTKLNNIIFKEAIEKWLVNARLQELDTCESCGVAIKKGTGFIVTRENPEEKDFLLWEQHVFCEDCYPDKVKFNENKDDLRF